MRRHRPQPWYGDLRARLRFEHAARAQHPSLSVQTRGRGYAASVVYRLTIEVPEYEPRNVVISVRNGPEPYVTSIVADGPTNSPHLYGDHKL
jgi:hypothetical protein